MKKTLLYGLVLFLFNITASEANAQLGPGLYTEEGFGVTPGVATTGDVTEISALAGYAFSPFELGLQGDRTSIDGVDLTVTGVGPYVAAYPVRQEDDYPLSAMISSSYSHYFFSGALAEGVDISGNMFTVGLTTFRTHEMSDNLKTVFLTGLTYSRESVEGGGSSDSDDGVSYSIGLSLLFGSSESEYFAVTPSISMPFDEGDTAYGISVSLISPE